MQKPTSMPATAPAVVQRFHQMPRTIAGKLPAAASEKAQATIERMSAGLVDANQAAPTATATSRVRAKTRSRVVDALGSNFLVSRSWLEAVGQGDKRPPQSRR